MAVIPFLTAATEIIGRFIPDADKKRELAHELATLAEKQAHEIALAQIKVNESESKSTSIFIAGWRPFIGWTCGAAFLYHFIVQPFMLFIASIYGVQVQSPPELDMVSLMTVLGGLLGLGTLRTYEKTKGLSR